MMWIPFASVCVALGAPELGANRRRHMALDRPALADDRRTTPGRRRRSRPLRSRAASAASRRLARRRQRRLELDRLAARGMHETQPPRVQEHPVEAQRRDQLAARERPVEREIAVLRIAGDRMARVGEMNPDLVRAAGLDRHVEQAEVGEAPRHPNQADRAPAALVVLVDGPDVAAAVGERVLAQGDVDHLERLGPGADDERRIGLADRATRRARAQVVLQLDQRRARLGDEEQARGLLVEPMDELEERVRAGRAASARSRRSSRRCRRGPRRRPACRCRRSHRPRGRRRTRAPALPDARCDRRRASAGSAPRRRARAACRRLPCPC